MIIYGKIRKIIRDEEDKYKGLDIRFAAKPMNGKILYRDAFFPITHIPVRPAEGDFVSFEYTFDEDRFVKIVINEPTFEIMMKADENPEQNFFQISGKVNRVEVKPCIYQPSNKQVRIRLIENETYKHYPITYFTQDINDILKQGEYITAICVPTRLPDYSSDDKRPQEDLHFQMVELIGKTAPEILEKNQSNRISLDLSHFDDEEDTTPPPEEYESTEEVFEEDVKDEVVKSKVRKLLILEEIEQRLKISQSLSKHLKQQGFKKNQIKKAIKPIWFS